MLPPLANNREVLSFLPLLHPLPANAVVFPSQSRQHHRHIAIVHQSKEGTNAALVGWREGFGVVVVEESNQLVDGVGVEVSEVIGHLWVLLQKGAYLAGYQVVAGAVVL